MAAYTSPDNRQYLPGYVTADAGLGYDFTHGTLSISESNIFNKFGYEFASSSYAVGPPTVGAGTLPVIARPLAPRTLQVTYSVTVGSGQTAAQAKQWHTRIDAATTKRLLRSRRRRTRVGQGGGGGFFASGAAGFPQTPPAESIRRRHEPAKLHDSQSAGTATQTLAAIKAYVAAIEAAKTAQGYPATLSAQMPNVPGFAIGYHPEGSTYALTFEPQSFDVMRGFFGCATLHIGTKDQATDAPPLRAHIELVLSQSTRLHAGCRIVHRAPTTRGRTRTIPRLSPAIRTASAAARYRELGSLLGRPQAGSASNCSRRSRNISPPRARALRHLPHRAAGQ